MHALIDERPLMILPTLVRLVGLERSLILQQVHFHLQNPKSGKEIDGQWWIWNTYDQWREDFPFWEERTIQKWILKLEKEGYLISAQLDAGEWSRRKYYRINYELLGGEIEELQRSQVVPDGAPSNIPDRAPSNIPDRACSYKEAETSSETSAERGARARAQEPPLEESLREEIPIDPLAARLDAIGVVLRTQYAFGPIDQDFEKLICTKTGKLNRMSCTPELLTEFLDDCPKLPRLRFVDEEFQAWAANRKRTAAAPRPAPSARVGLAPVEERPQQRKELTEQERQELRRHNEAAVKEFLEMDS